MEHNPYIALLIVTGLALIVPLFSRRIQRLQLPIVVGEILSGMIIGQSGLNLIRGSSTLDFLAEFGFVFLMFLSGLEVDFSLVLPSFERKEGQHLWDQPMGMAILILLGTLSLALAGAFGLSTIGIVEKPVLMGLILSTTSLGVVVPILKERHLLGTAFGQYLLVASSIADFATLLLLTVLIAIQSHGLTMELMLIPALLVLFMLSARLAMRSPILINIRRILDELSTATAQIRVRGAFALMVGWVVLAEALGVEVILGAFLAGVIAGLIAGRDDPRAREKLDAIGYGFFIPIFFIMVGVNFNLRVLLDDPSAMFLVPLLVVLAYLVKVVPGFILRLKFPWRESISGGFLLSSRLSLVIAASSIAVSIGAISQAVNADIILLAILSVTFSPMIFNRICPCRDPAQRQGVIIVGIDQMTEILAHRLLNVGEPIAIICMDRNRQPQFDLADLPIWHVNGDLIATLAQANAHQARALIDLTTLPEETLEICRIARQVYSIPTVVARVAHINTIPQLQSLGVRVVQPALATAMALEGAIRYPTAFDILSQQSEDMQFREVTLTNPMLADITVRRLQLPREVQLVSVQREQTAMVPHGDTILRLGDQIALIGCPDPLADAVALFAG